MEQLSTGSKINSASDDAAGLAMASKFTSQIKGLDMAVKNANDGVSMISTAEGALNEVTNMLQRMRELAVQSSNGTMTQEDRDYMDKEYQALDSEIDRIEKNTQWNSTNILDGTVGTSGTVNFQVSSNYTAGTSSNAVNFALTDVTALLPTGASGIKADGTVLTSGTTGALTATNTGAEWASALGAAKDSSGNAATLQGAIPTTLTGSAALTSTVKTAAVTGSSNDIIAVDFGNLGTDTAGLTDVKSQTNAQAAIGKLDTAIKNVNEQRATFGAASNRLTHAVDNMTNIRVNAEASRSRIEDTDYAKTTSELAKAQIIAQAGTAMLAQANQSSQSVLSLLR
jgi:flagellin